tara:strand:- start:97 stop:354 length:258 start_codon:yes stop_codon:yes gene_type:complete
MAKAAVTPTAMPVIKLIFAISSMITSWKHLLRFAHMDCALAQNKLVRQNDTTNQITYSSFSESHKGVINMLPLHRQWRTGSTDKA